MTEGRGASTGPTIAAARDLFEPPFAGLRGSIEGLSAEGLAWRPPARDANPITVLATHAMHSCRWWLSIALGAERPHRDRPSEFVAVVGSEEELLGQVDALADDCRALLDPSTPFDPEATHDVPDDEPVSSAWALLHAIEHLSEHSAVAQLTRQLWDARSG
ncbi:MAG TPA: DinB family protein [Actinomycetota bacterium]|nr:DinB family protein [Actinomycetota bacterium]